MEQPEVKNDAVTSLLGTWVRIVISDGRAFVGSLKAVDDTCNVVLANAVEVRPMTARPGEEERKGHRGFVMLKNVDIVSIARRKQQQVQQQQEEGDKGKEEAASEAK